MKKIFCVALVAAMVLSLTGCKSRTTHTVDTFTEVMEGQSYEIYDVSDSTETNGLEATILIAVGENFQVEYYQFETDEIASSVFANNRSIAEKVASSSHTSISSSDYQKYTQTTTNMYWFIARVGNTMIYCVADKEYKNAVEDVMEVLGVR